MKILLTALQELYGLFVEDGSYAIAILAWIGITAFLFPFIPGGEVWRAPALFLGLVILLFENIVRSVRKTVIRKNR